MPNNQTEESVLKLKAEIAEIKKDIFDLKKIILAVEQAESKAKEDQDLNNLEKNIAAMS